jgi:hypothetical protein
MGYVSANFGGCCGKLIERILTHHVDASWNPAWGLSDLISRAGARLDLRPLTARGSY